MSLSKKPLYQQNDLLTGRSHNNKYILLSLLLAVLSIILISFSVTAEVPINQQSLNLKAPPETIHFGRLVGQWKIKDSGKNAKGEWQDGPGANWNFYWILGGTAIQDDWISPGYDKPAPKNGRQYGTNLRIYNPKTKGWETAWTSNSGAKVDTFKAVSDDEKMVMTGFYSGAETRITFYNISEKHFSWKMEQQNKENGEWSEIYRIEADKVN